MATEDTPRPEDPTPASADQLLEADRTLEQRIAALDDEQQKRLAETLRALMDEQRARIEYAESRRSALATIGGVLLAAGLAALLPVAASGWGYFPTRLGLLTLAVSLIVTGVVVVGLWASQTNWDYPFKTVSSTWKHFYRDALPGGGKPEVPWHSRLSATLRSSKEEQYSQLRTGFLDLTAAMRTSPRAVTENPH